MHVLRLAVVLLLVHGSLSNIYEFTMAPNEELCFTEFFKNGSMPSINYQAYKLTKGTMSEELDDLTKAGVVDKRKGTIKITLRIESVSGIVYTAINKSDQTKNFKVKETENVNMCFKNPEKSLAFVIFDLRTGVYSGDVSNIPTAEETDELMQKLEGIRARLDNSLSLYRQMESYEERHLQASSTVLSGILLISQIMIAAIAIVGYGITLFVERSLKQRKSA